MAIYQICLIWPGSNSPPLVLKITSEMIHNVLLAPYKQTTSTTWLPGGHTFLNLQITRSDISPHIKWAVSLVIAYGHFNLPRGLYGDGLYHRSLLVYSISLIPSTPFNQVSDGSHVRVILEGTGYNPHIGVNMTLCLEPSVMVVAW